VRVTPLRDESGAVAGVQDRAARRDALRIAGLVVGDAIAFLVFAGVGRGSHHEATGLSALAQVALTAAPFALGWFIVAPFVGAFRRAKIGTPRAMLGRTELAWLASWPAALLLRWAFTGKVPPLSFAVVTLIANALFLAVWRGAFALVAARLRPAGKTA
jgi:Protein of unknown function (DUF3054)